ncbi:hypothetical protein [Actinoplanes sp. NPDC049681]|uniref:hypothetical protein n=1 Tax=Actinoplanes sp. NPDC049681 TaxID=3363905 RepID=UPI0037A38AF2
MSVFRASNSPTAWPEGPDPFPDDGPTERLGGPDAGPAPAPPRRGVVVAVSLAMLALLVAAASALLAWRAIQRSEQAYARSLTAAAPAPTPAAGYGEETLRIQAGCTGVTFLDLDEPRVNAAGQISDLRYDSRCGDEQPRITLAPGAVAGSDVGDADVDGPGCAKAIRTSPLGGGVIVPVHPGLVLCVLTGTGTPPATGVRLVRVEVTETAGDGRATVRATSWPAA